MRRLTRLIVPLLVVSAALLASGCTSPDKTEEASEEPSHPTSESTLQIPDADRSRENPFSGAAGSVESGKRAFSNMCSPCHGTTGQGDGELAEQLKVEVPDFTDPKEQGKYTDGEMFYILTHGHEAMPAQEDRLTDELKWHLVSYIRTLDSE